MFNRIARFSLCLALLSLSACAGMGRQTHGAARGTAQGQKPLIAELIIIGAIADADADRERDGEGRRRSSSSSDNPFEQTANAMLAVGAVGAAISIAYLVFKDSGDLETTPRRPKAPSAPFKSTNNVTAAPGFIQAARDGVL